VSTPDGLAIALFVGASVSALAAEQAEVPKAELPEVARSDVPSTPPPAMYECVDGQDRAAAAAVAAYEARDPNVPFKPGASGVPGGIPFYVSSDHSLFEVLLLYHQFHDVKAGTKWRFLPPLFLWICHPESHTLVTPVFGFRQDAEGIAGFALTWYWRRDRLEDSDVLFPLVWSFRHRSTPGGPMTHGSFAFVPLFFWNHEENGDHYTIVPPLVWNWGGADLNTTVVGPAYYRNDHTGWSAGFVPLYFGGKHGSDSFHLVPPLLTAVWGNADETHVYAINTYVSARPNGYTLAFVPLAFFGREGEEHHEIVFPLVWNWGDATSNNTIAATFYRHVDPNGWAAGLAPIYFGGRRASEGYDVVPPLLFAHSWGVDGSKYWVGNTYYTPKADGYTLVSFPLVFFGREAQYHHEFVFPLVWNWGDGTSNNTIAATFYRHVDPSGWAAGLVPLYFGGQHGTDSYHLVPPALTAVWWSSDETHVYAINTYVAVRPNGYSVSFLPLVFLGREGEEHHEVVFPLIWNWGDATSNTTVAATFYRRVDPTGWAAGLAPIYFGGEHGADVYHVVPPLLFAHWRGAEESKYFFVDTYVGWRKDGFTWTSFPLLFLWREGEEHHEVLFPLVWNFGDPTSNTTVVATFYRHVDPTGWHAGLAPIYFGGEHGADKYHVVPPLLFAHWRDAEESKYFFVDTYVDWRKDGFTWTSLPLLFLWRQGEEHHEVVFPLVWNWGDETSNTTIAATFYRHVDPTGWDAGLAPIYFGGEHSADKYHVVPPLLFAHWRDAEESKYFFVDTYVDFRNDGFTWTSFPLLFLWRQGQAHHEVVFPLVWNWGDETSNTTIAATFYRHVDPTGWHAGLAPIYFGGEHGADEYHVVPPLLFAHWRDAEESKYFLVDTYVDFRNDGFTWTSFPLLFLWREGQAHHEVVFPLAWNWGDATSNTTIAATFYRHADPTGWHAGLAPIYFGGEHGADAYHVVPPLLFAHWRDAEASRYFFVDTFVEWRKNGLTWTSFPLLFLWREGEEHHEILFPLVWTWGDATDNTTIAATFYRHVDPSGWHAGLAPIYFGGEHGADKYHVVPPLLFAHWRDAEESKFFFVETYVDWRKNGFTWNSFPLVFLGREGEQHHEVVFPLVWNWGDETSNTTIAATFYRHVDPSGWHAGLAPIYFGGEHGTDKYHVVPPLLFAHWRDSEESKYFFVETYVDWRRNGFTWNSFPLVFLGREGEEHHEVVFPLVWNWGDETSNTTIAATFYRHVDPTGWHAGLAPIYFGGEHGTDKYHVVPPLLFAHWRDSEESKYFFVETYVDWRRNGFTWNSFPLVFLGREGEEHHEVVFPLVWNWGDETSNTTIAATFYRHVDPTGWHAGLAPIYFGGEHGADKYHVVPPLLFAHWRDAEESKYFFVETYAAWRKDGFTWTSFPLLFLWRQGEEHHEVVFPLVWNWGDETSNTTIAATFYRHVDPTGWYAGLAPIYFGGEHGAEKYHVVPPLLFAHWRDAEESKFFFVETYVDWRQNGFTWNSFPLVFLGREGEVHHEVVFPLVWNWGDETSNTTIAATFYRHVDPSGWAAGLVPLYLGGEHGVERYHVVPPLLSAVWKNAEETNVYAINTFVSERKNGYTVNSFPLIFFGREGADHHEIVFPLVWNWGDETTNTTIAALFYRKADPTGWAAGFVPLYFGAKRGAESYHLVLPALTAVWENADETNVYAVNTYYQSRPSGFTFNFLPLVFLGRDLDTHHEVVFPLFWRWGDASSTSTLAGPLYVHNDAEGSSATLFPLFHYHQTADSKLLLSPLFVHHELPERERTVVLALYWRFLGPDVDARVVFPLYWDFKLKTEGKRLTTLFPLYWQYETPTDTSHWVLTFMWGSGQTPRGPSWSFRFFPLVHLESNNPDHFFWQFLEGLIGHERQGDAERWQIFYIWFGGNRPAAPLALADRARVARRASSLASSRLSAGGRASDWRSWP
jgi:hypothetical protein